jgi:hypothetical protein
VTVSDTGIGIAQQQRAWQGKARRSASGEILDGPVLADSVEKLVFRSCSKSYRPADASLVLGRGGPCDLLLRSTKRLLTNASTIRRANCQLQGAHARIRAHRNLEFFNRIGPTPAIEPDEYRTLAGVSFSTTTSRRREPTNRRQAICGGRRSPG